MTLDPHTAERFILIGCHQAMSRPSALRILLHPEQRKQWYALALAFLNDTIKYDSTSCSVFVQPDFKDWPETQTIIQLVHAHYQQARINQNTVEAIGARQGRNFIRNLKRVCDAEEHMRDVRHSLRSMAHQTALIVGAGVSFEESASVAAKHTGPVIAVNTSAGACAQRDVFPDVVVCTESKPVTEGVARMNVTRSSFAMDLTGHPNNWPVTERASYPVLCFMGTEPNLVPYAQKLGMLPLAYGSSCTTAAVSLALAMGAARVVLVGQDCSFSEELEQKDPRLLTARMYASGTPYEQTVVSIDVLYKRALIEKPTVGEYETDVVAVPGVDGVDRWTTHSMLSFAHWFRDQPDDVRGKIVNCTASGVLIPGIGHAPLGECIDTAANYRGQLDTVNARLAAWHFMGKAGRVLRHLNKLAQHGRVLEAGDGLVIEWGRRHPILNMWTAPERLLMRRLDLSQEERGHRVADAIRQACREIVDAAAGQDGTQST